jgi:hypothetical protein
MNSLCFSQVSFFETNGLRHREAILPNAWDARAAVRWLSWSADGKLLGVLLESETAVDDGATTIRQQALQLWHRDNYHWYCKQELLFGGAVAGARLLAVAWDSETPLRLHLVLHHGGESDSLQLRRLDYAWEYTTTAAGSSSSNDAAAVCGIATTDAAGGVRLTPWAWAQVRCDVVWRRDHHIMACILHRAGASTDGLHLTVAAKSASCLVSDTVYCIFIRCCSNIVSCRRRQQI